MAAGRIYKAVDNKQNKRIRKLETRVRNLKNSKEVKFHDVEDTDDMLLAPASVLINEIVQGDDEKERDGGQIRMKSVSCTLRIVANATAESNSGRLILVKFADHGATANLLDVLQNGGTNLFSMISSYKKNSDAKFTVLADKRFVVTDAPGDTNQKFVTLSHTWKAGVEAVYPDGSNEPMRGRIYLFHMSDQAVTGPAFHLYSRVTYTDS